MSLDLRPLCQYTFTNKLHQHCLTKTLLVCWQLFVLFIRHEKKMELPLGFERVHLGECHTPPDSCLFKSLCLSQPGSYTQPLKSNQKIPKDPALGRGSAPSLSLWGWLPAESNKGLCYAALLQISVVKAQWEGAWQCKTHAAETISSITQIKHWF